MSSVYQIFADNVTSISELKKNPMAVLAQAEGMPVAVLNRNQPAFYCVPVKVYELLMEKLDDIELAKLVNERKDSDEIELSLDDL